jgi:glycosyltransferase involved in cell wall biosynthesis
MTKKNYKISLVMPVYNEEKFIGKCLESLTKQNYKNFEALMIDDGSTDKTIKILKKWARRDERIKVFTQTNVGLGISRNRGVKLSTGEVLGFVDGDMEFPADYLEKLVQPINEGKEIATTHATEIAINREKSLWAYMWSKKIRRKLKLDQYATLRLVKKDEFTAKTAYGESRYFQDVVPTIHGKAIDVICYHNNPDSIKEGVEMSFRIGRGFVQMPVKIKNYITKYFKRSKRLIFNAGIIWVLILLLWQKYLNLSVLYWVVGLPIILCLLYALVKAMKDKKITLLFFLPYYWLVRLVSLLAGMMVQTPLQINKKIFK